MEFEVLKKSHLKRNILIGVVVVAIISAIVLNFTRARYRVTESIPLVNGTINYTPYDLNIVALYIDGVEAEKLDSNTDYTLDTENSTCTYKDGSTIPNLTLNYDSKTKAFSITPYVTRGTKCILYFEEKPLASEIILVGKDIQERSSFSSVLSTSTNGIIYQEQTNDGTTYYFAGDTDENWVSFAGYYWRIIRINEDGSIRMIYNGISTSQTGETTQYTTSTFNTSRDNNMYVGYMYESNQVHGLTSNSRIKGMVDGWYESNILGNPEEDLISKEAGFCGDRLPSTNDTVSNGLGGTGTTETYYGAYIRLVNSSKMPTFECPDDSNDLYTVAASNKGNRALTYPVGLITADEIAYAGGVYNASNTRYYLYINQNYWSISPSDYINFSGRHIAGVFIIGENGDLSSWSVNQASEGGVRPVINLRADVTLTGSGTTSDPYLVS